MKKVMIVFLMIGVLAGAGKTFDVREGYFNLSFTFSLAKE